MRILLASLAGAAILMTSAAPAFAHHKMGHPEIGYGTKAAKAARAARTAGDHCDEANKDSHAPASADMSADDCRDMLEQPAPGAGELTASEHCEHASEPKGEPARSPAETAGK